MTLFEDTPQISVRRGADITPLKEAVELAKFVPLSEITEANAGKWARTQGEIVNVTPGDKNTKLTLSDGDKRLTVLIWPDAWAGLPQADFQPGAKLTVQGEVNLFRGDLEIVPELPSDVEVLARAAPVEAQAKSIGAITPDDVKSLIVTQGTIEKASPFSLGIALRTRRSLRLDHSAGLERCDRSAEAAGTAGRRRNSVRHGPDRRVQRSTGDRAALAGRCRRDRPRRP